MIMTKNILKGDMVYHMKTIMKSGHKITLPQIGNQKEVPFPSLFDASRLLKDEPHPATSRSYQKSLGEGIKSNHNSLVRL